MGNEVEDKIMQEFKSMDYKLELMLSPESDLFTPESTFALAEKEQVSSTDIHDYLMAAGFSPAYGNLADIADAILYATEGEFGSAALSGLSAIPVVGQFVTSQRLLKAAERSGEKFHTVYRGVDKWHKGKMIKDGKFVSGGSRIGPHFKDSTKELKVTENNLIKIKEEKTDK